MNSHNFVLVRFCEISVMLRMACTVCILSGLILSDLTLSFEIYVVQDVQIHCVNGFLYERQKTVELLHTSQVMDSLPKESHPHESQSTQQAVPFIPHEYTIVNTRSHTS